MEHDRFILAHAHSVVGDQRHATLRHALVDSRNWVIYHNGRAIVPWVQHVLNIEGDWRPGIGYNPGESVKVDGFYDLPRVPLHTAVLGGGNSNIYHYTVDHLAGLFHTATSGSDVARTPVLCEAFWRWQRELVDCYSCGGPTVILAKSHVLYEVDELHLPRRCFDFEGRNTVPNWTDWMRMTTAHVDICPVSPERIYISRNRARSRGIANEAELEVLLHRRGFVTLHPQDLPFDEQIRLFKRARVAIGPTGAAFSNMIYAAPGSQLIELMPTGSWQPPQIEFLMQAADITYANIPVPGAFEDTRLHVDVDEVGRRLGELGIT